MVVGRGGWHDGRMKRWRRCITARGTREETRSHARWLCHALPQEDVLWVSESDPGATRPTRARRLLGRSYDCVILDLHDGLDADVLAACQGFVWGGGALVLRMPPMGEAPGGQARLAVHPYGVEEVGERMWARFEARVGERPWARRLGPATRAVEGSAEQAEALRRLRALFEGPRPGMMAVLAGRG